MQIVLITKKLQIQEPDKYPQLFSYESEYCNKTIQQKQLNCYITYTNPKTHAFIQKGLIRSPIYGKNKTINSLGPRYCPSIEDKVVKFAQKDKHQIFLEPEGLRNNEVLFKRNFH